MKPLKLVSVFFIVGLLSGLLSVALGFSDLGIRWLGLFTILLPGLAMSVIIVNKRAWIPLTVSWKQYLSASLIIVAAYPIGILVMIAVSAIYDWLYSFLYPKRWHELIQSGNFNTPGWTIGLIVAAVVGAILVSFSLKVITQRWDRLVFGLMIIAGLSAIPLSFTIASLFEVSNWLFVLYPVGASFFSALCGYWLLRSNMITTHWSNEFPQLE